MNKDNIWIGVEDLTNDPSFVEASKSEFFELPIIDAMGQEEEVIEEVTKGSNRRDFLKYMGFGLGAATLAASCEIPVKKAIPYVTKPDAVVPGVAAYYASSYVRGGDYCAVLVKTREGRPIKIEGNTLSSVTKGGTSARAQASVLDLYNTGRFRGPQKTGEEGKDNEALSWADLDKEVGIALLPDAQIRIVTHTIMSPSMKQAIADFTAKYPNTKVVTYDPVSSAGILLANEASFGKKVIPAYHFDKADIIVNFGADFLGTWISPIEYAADFITRRKPGKNMSRLVQFESGMSLTGSNADSRVHIKPSETGAALVHLHNEIAAKLGGSPLSAGKLGAKAKAAIASVASELVAANGKALVIAGSNDVNEQIVVNSINNMLGSYGSTISFGGYSNQRQGIDADVQGLIGEMKSVDAVIIYGDANPAYDIPNADKFAAALKSAKVSVSLATVPNETSACCKYIAPDHHYLESWGDAEPKDGHLSLIQPTIAPLFDTRSAMVTLLTWAGATLDSKQPAHEYVKSVWQKNIFGRQSKFLSTQAFWDNSLHDGVLDLGGEDTGVSFAGDVAAAAAKVGKPKSDGIEIAFYETVGVGGGQFADNPWLQELPDPLTRVVWDNPLLVPIKYNSEGLGNKYTFYKGMKNGDEADMIVGDTTQRTVIYNQFGQMEGTAAMALGYGRSIGSTASKNVGTNVYNLLKVVNGTTQYYITGADISDKKGRDKSFACVQHHHTLGVTGEYNGETLNVDERILGHVGPQGGLTERSIIFNADLPELTEKVEELKHKREEFADLNNNTLYPGFDRMLKQGHHWGMSVDLSACIGCGACQVACIAENNVPVVGKYEVAKHHEMTWLRIDRYFYGDVENPNAVYQPMMCQHCDNAPCENVCPVNATNHSGEGLNQMTYNRCIGTRYCANNCPYKVRRFNWLDYTTADLFPWNEPKYKDGETYMGDDLTRMVLNPDVTVRSRGVIEKCSFCVQRIQESKLQAKVERRQLRDGDMKTACQTACPTGAIVFGDMNDGKSELRQKMADGRAYRVIEETNVESSVHYMMKVTNKNQAIG